MRILDWNCKETDQIDIKTRKTFAKSGSFHPNNDPDRLNFRRKDEGHGDQREKWIHEIYMSKKITTLSGFATNYYN